MTNEHNEKAITCRRGNYARNKARKLLFSSFFRRGGGEEKSYVFISHLLFALFFVAAQLFFRLRRICCPSSSLFFLFRKLIFLENEFDLSSSKTVSKKKTQRTCDFFPLFWSLYFCNTSYSFFFACFFSDFIIEKV